MSSEISSYDRALYRTWQLSFDHVKQRSELSVKLLQLWAYFDNNDIWFELLRHRDSSKLDWFSRVIKDELREPRSTFPLCFEISSTMCFGKATWTPSDILNYLELMC
jgi:hypothetical protein